MEFGPLLLLLLSLLFLLREQASAMRLLGVSVPPYLKKGESALLDCRFDMEFDNLGSITWYKDNEHIYSFSQSYRQKQVFTIDGVKIDAHRSNAQTLFLHSVSLNSTGTYACEVSNDRAPFKAVRGEAYMEVLELPREDPKITGEEKIYASGDILALNCTSDFSYPAAQLFWYINGILVESGSEVLQMMSRGLYSTRSSLKLELNPLHLIDGRIEVKCLSQVETSPLARMHHLDVRTSKIYVEGDASLIKPSITLLSIALLLLSFVAND